mgnify:CR=1 FL=1
MTGLEANKNLIDYFSKKDSLNYEDIEKLEPKGINKNEKIAAYLSALEDLTVSQVLFKNQNSIIDNKEIIWVLKKSLGLYQQNVILNSQTSFAISSVINQFAEMAKAKNLICNPLLIQEKDLLSLIEIITLLSENNKDNGDSDNKKK